MLRSRFSSLFALVALVLAFTTVNPVKPAVVHDVSSAGVPRLSAPQRPDGPASVNGYALPGGKASIGLRVTLERAGFVVAESFTAADGSYRLRDVAPGAYSLRAYDASGISFDVRDLVLAPGQRASIVLGNRAALAVGLPRLAQNDSACETTTITGTATISGTVTDAVSGDPISSISVVATAANSSGFTTTDSNGNYVLNELPAGEYVVEFYTFSKNYLDEYYDDKPDFASADRVTVADGAAVTNIDAALSAGGIISGTVSGVGGIKLDDVDVDAYRIVAGSRVFEGSQATDEDGQFRIDRLPTGTYELEVEVSYFDNEVTRAYLNRVVENINVTAGQTTANTNITLSKGAQISGSVVSGSTPLDNISVIAYDAASGDYVGFIGNTDSDGTYISQGLPTGSYAIEFSNSNDIYLDEFYNNVQTLDAATAVNVTAPNVTPNINADLAEGGSITGTVTGVGNDPLAGVEVEVRIANGSLVDGDFTETDGTYEVRGLTSGDYTVFFDPINSSQDEVRGYIAEYYNNQADRASANVVTVTAPNASANINAELTPGATISGCVSASDTGRGLDDSFSVSIYTTDGNYLRNADTDFDGTYNTGGLLPGSYILEFDPSRFSDADKPGYILEFYDNARDFGAATPITLATSNIENIDAELDRGGGFSGLVTGVGDEPLTDISIDVIDAAGDFVGFGSTDDDGRYFTDGVPPGQYTLRFQPRSYDRDAQYVSLEVGPQGATVGSFTAVNAQLSIGGQISGRVTRSGGVGLDDVSVLFYNADGNFVDSIATLATGVYTSTGLAAGEYRVQFRPFSSGVSNQYAPEYYDNKLDIESADAVEVTVGEVTANINAELIIGSVISGRVTAAGSGNLGGASVRVYNTGGELLIGATTSADGASALQRWQVAATSLLHAAERQQITWRVLQR
ncbi:hypothetical protein HC891_09660 [Candidatus Gracilibacteria bacterium]|nr:hypothetical protein [Candidatus Gracilibacteria bacterium]